MDKPIISPHPSDYYVMHVFRCVLVQLAFEMKNITSNLPRSPCGQRMLLVPSTGSTAPAASKEVAYIMSGGGGPLTIHIHVVAAPSFTFV